MPWVVGETVMATMMYTDPETNGPMDPVSSVGVVKLNGVVQNIPNWAGDFARYQQGRWTLAVPTATLAPGTYTLVVTTTDAAGNVVIDSDDFVLRASP